MWLREVGKGWDGVVVGIGVGRGRDCIGSVGVVGSRGRGGVVVGMWWIG